MNLFANIALLSVLDDSATQHNKNVILKRVLYLIINNKTLNLLMLIRFANVPLYIKFYTSLFLFGVL